MNKPILIIGHIDAGKACIAKILAERNIKEDDVIILTPEEAEKQGLKIAQPTETQTNFDELVVKIEAVKHEQIFTPKKVHPKHQQQNKYRYK